MMNPKLVSWHTLADGDEVWVHNYKEWLPAKVKSFTRRTVRAVVYEDSKGMHPTVCVKRPISEVYVRHGNEGAPSA